MAVTTIMLIEYKITGIRMTNGVESNNMLRFYNGKVITMNGGTEAVENEVWTDGAKICYVGPKRDDMPHFKREIDLHGDVIMPGFKNAHTHSAMTFLRSFADDLPLARWLNEKVFPMEDKLTPDDVYIFTKLAILEYISSGITSSFDMYFHLDAYAAANIDCGFKTVICGALTRYDKRREDIEDHYLKYNALHPLIKYALGFHAEYTNDLDGLNYIAELSRKYSASVYSHNSETKSEVDECIARHNMTPTELFDSIGLFEHGGGGFHCTYMSDNDISIFARKGLWAVTNPASNLKLASGIAPVQKLLNAGVNMAIGTDGPASNNALDMFREMYLVTALQKYAENDAAACDADTVLKMATSGGAYAMGLSDCDIIAEGKQADMVVINMSRPNMQPVHDIAGNLVYSGSKENVRMTLVAGRILYENGNFYVGEDIEKIYEKANTALKKLLER